MIYLVSSISYCRIKYSLYFCNSIVYLFWNYKYVYTVIHYSLFKYLFLSLISDCGFEMKFIMPYRHFIIADIDLSASSWPVSHHVCDVLFEKRSLVDHWRSLVDHWRSLVDHWRTKRVQFLYYIEHSAVL